MRIKLDRLEAYQRKRSCTVRALFIEFLIAYDQDFKGYIFQYKRFLESIGIRVRTEF